ncbi:MAG: S-methyl-5-thioribose-1-phosphate isomerase, partial [Acidimicrobiaceae bacterium]|nr:S-methyl-5-thioribose-1-phosphate isomerase [Acidimicrobiaceae bacterium]
MRTIEWCGDHVRLIDQTLLPGELTYVEIRDVNTMIDAIRRLVVRGAPALGVAGAFGVVLSAHQVRRSGEDIGQIHVDASHLAEARPTAVNLRWGVLRMMNVICKCTDIEEVCTLAEKEAVAILEADVKSNEQMSLRGADFVASLVKGQISVQTHCNAGGLACVEWGTALGVVRAIHERGMLHKVFASETRPLLQGARLTAFELAQMGINHAIVVDGAGPSVIAAGLVDVVLVGADRIAANGDTANKIGTYPLALAASRAGVPFIVVAPESTVDLDTISGKEIQIELRDEDEVLSWNGDRVAP